MTDTPPTRHGEAYTGPLANEGGAGGWHSASPPTARRDSQEKQAYPALAGGDNRERGEHAGNSLVTKVGTAEERVMTRDAIENMGKLLDDTAGRDAVHAAPEDIIIRLKQYDGEQWETTACYNGLRDEAADMLQRLEAENARLREAVKRRTAAIKKVAEAVREEAVEMMAVTDTPTTDLVAYLRSRPLDRRGVEAADRLERLERLEAECERLRKSWGLTMQSRQVWRRLAESVAQMVLDTATVETPPELLKAAREALGK